MKKTALTLLVSTFIICSTVVKLPIEEVPQKQIEITQAPAPIAAEEKEKAENELIAEQKVDIVREVPNTVVLHTDKVIEVKKKKPHYNPKNLKELSNLTAEQINILLQNTGLRGLGEAYVEAEKEHGINALFLISLNGLESGWGNSSLSRGKNNISGYQAYNNNTGAAKAFASKADCIDVTAKHISQSYLDPNGKYYNGVGTKQVNIKYCLSDNGKPNYSWTEKINDIADRLVVKLQ